MSIKAIGSTPNFTGKYSLNANQQMDTAEACLKRDALMGFWAVRAKNGEKVQNKLIDFYKGDYETNKTKELNIKFNLPDSMDKDFEESMNYIGQKFEKIG